MGSLERLAALFHHRWSVPVLAELDRTGGAKLVTLQSRLGASRDALRATFDTLIESGLLARNPGYGHPMRPEYVLTALGRRRAPACARLMRVLSRLKLVPVALRKWPLLVTLAARRTGGRFGEIKAALPGITARALTLALKTLQGAGMIERRVTEDYPPGTRYRLTRTGKNVAPLVEKL